VKNVSQANFSKDRFYAPNSVTLMTATSFVEISVCHKTSQYLLHVLFFPFRFGKQFPARIFKQLGWWNGVQ
jgi:hypothetical protein